MATVTTQGTKFTLSILPPRRSERFWIRTEIRIKNEYVSYRAIEETISFDEIESLLKTASRLLAGGYEKEYSLTFEKAGLAVDFYAQTKDGLPLSREERRSSDCVMAIRLLMRSKDKKSFLGGVYSLLLHRAEIESFLAELWKEYEKNLSQLARGNGKYLFVGVSPLGYQGCNYWYLDETGNTRAGEYVWVRMGRRNTEQIAYVDAVRYFDEDTAPYDVKKVKRILRKATKEEVTDL